MSSDTYDPVWEAERELDLAEREVKRIASDLELAEAHLVIARIRLARAKQAERDSR